VYRIYVKWPWNQTRQSTKMQSYDTICETLTLNDQSFNRVNVAWNNSFRRIFSRFYRESVKPLQYFCQTLPILYFIHQRKLLFWRKLAMHNNNFLLSLSRLVQNWFYAIGSEYDITTISASVGQIKSAIWAKFTQTVWKFSYICIG